MKSNLLVIFLYLCPIFVFGQEICNNSIDDDNDGLVDLFDPDCPCETLSYQAQCAIECQIIPDSFQSIELSLKWQSEVMANTSIIFFGNIVIGDIDNDGVIEIVAHGKYDSLQNDNIVIINGINGIIENKFEIPAESGMTTIGDVDNDGFAEIFVSAYNIGYDSVKIYSFDNLGNEKWQTPLVKSFSPLCNLADFNQDGIPEVYMNSYIYNAQTGSLLLGIYDEWHWNLSNSVASDLMIGSGLELAMGSKYYALNIANSIDSIGNAAIKIEVVPPTNSNEYLGGNTQGCSLLYYSYIKILHSFNLLVYFSIAYLMLI